MIIFLLLKPLDQGETKQTHTFWQACFTVQTHMPTFNIIGLRICLISSITSSTSFKQGCLSWVILVLHTSSKALSGVNNPTRIPNHVHQFLKCLKCRHLILIKISPKQAAYLFFKSMQKTKKKLTFSATVRTTLLSS